jgi:nitrate reductase NapA
MPGSSCTPRTRKKRGLQRGDGGQGGVAARRDRRPVETRGRNKPPVGPGLRALLRRGRLVNKLTLDATCPISKETDFKKCACKVVKA